MAVVDQSATILTPGSRSRFGVDSACGPGQHLNGNDMRNSTTPAYATTVLWSARIHTVAIAAVAVRAVFNWRVLVFPPALIPIAAVLFLFHAYLRSDEQDRHAVGQ